MFSNAARAVLASILIVASTVGITFAVQPAHPPHPLAVAGSGPQMDLTGIAAPLQAREWYAGVTLRDALARQEEIRAAARESERARTTRSTRPTTGGAVTGSCAAMAPAGFPDWIVQRESRGNASAVNPSSGAEGCAQILPSHFSRDCAGLGYAACWALLYREHGLQPWAG